MIDTVIFLGAGASKAEGAPLQGDLFREYFASSSFRHGDRDMNDALTNFFSTMFRIDVHNPVVNFPTFEEALGLCDLAILRKERFRDLDIDIEDGAKDASLRRIGTHLVFLMAEILTEKLGRRGTHHRELTQNLMNAGVLRRVAFISTNYDIIIDNALTEMYGDVDLDYGLDFWNFGRPNDWKRPNQRRHVSLFKPHGSLNWLLCSTCNELRLTPKEKSVTKLISKAHEPCPQCGNPYSPLIVPPTFYKDFGNVFLSTVWNKAEIALRSAKHVVFCGYSFPDADMHIKYLLKRIQTNRDRRHPLRFSVINHFRGKDAGVAVEEEKRYKRFLGEDVNYTTTSFEEFARAPMSVVGH